MESKFFQQGNNIYECKTSPTQMGGYFSTSYLKSAIKSLEQRWKGGSKPSGYRYVFPVNYLDDQGKAVIEDFKSRHPDVDIRYYDCDHVQKLVNSLEKVNTLPELVNYINRVRDK
jgi:hypothetical protein